MGLLPTLKLLLSVCLGWLFAAQIGKFCELPSVTVVVALLIGYFIAKSDSLKQLFEQNRTVFSIFLGSRGYSAFSLLSVSGCLIIVTAIVVVALFGDLGVDQYVFLGLFGLMPPIFLSHLKTLVATRAEDSSK